MVERRSLLGRPFACAAGWQAWFVLAILPVSYDRYGCAKQAFRQNTDSGTRR